MKNLAALAALKTFHYGTEHVVAQRRHGISVMSLRLALLCGAKIMAATLPAPQAPIVHLPAPVEVPEQATTCYLQSADGCWSGK